MTLGMMSHGTMEDHHMVVWEKPPKGLKHVSLVTCMYGHHCDKCQMEKNILGGEPTIR